MIKVLCHGVFDVLHIGHIKYLESAKKYGDHLTVSVTSDKYVNKGPGRPHFDQTIRIKMLESLKLVDKVILSDAPTAVDIINEIRPHYYVKGPDYEESDKDYTGNILKEEQAVIRHGGEMIFTKDETHSSSHLVNSYFSPWSDEQAKIIAEVKRLGGMNEIKRVLSQISDLSVRVIGESITDEYVFCITEGVSSKSPNLSSRYVRAEEYSGGSTAIYNHIKTFVKQCQEESINGLFWARKTRYISNAQRIFEVTHIPDNLLDIDTTDLPHKHIEELINPKKHYDVSLLCDFGHNLFENEFLKACQKIPGFVALNCQTNSSNYGFNLYTKHKRYDYLSIDVREARLGLHDRFSTKQDLYDNLKNDICKSVSMTLGPDGSYYSGADTNYVHSCPAFTDKVIDTIGAGDAFFALTALLVKIKCPDPIIPFLGNVFAGLKTKIIGNKEHVTKAQLMKAVECILK